MTRHIHTAVLARYRGGDLGERRSRRVAAHLATCRRCAAASSGLADVSHLLRAAPAPPMPADITARIEAALAAEAAQPSRAVAHDSQPAGGGRGLSAARHSAAGPGREAPARRRQPQWPALRSPVALRVLAGTAAAAVIVVGGAAVAGQLAGGGSSAGSGASATSGGSEAAGSSESSMARAPGAASAAPHSTPGPSGVVGVGGQASSAAGPALKYRAVHGTATFVPVAASADFGRQGLAGQVRGLLSAGHKTPMGTPSRSATSRFFSGIPVSTLEGCVSRIAAGGRVRLVDVDRYQGSKATIIVVAPAGGGRQQIWVVGPGCSGSDPQVITRAALPSGG